MSTTFGELKTRLGIVLLDPSAKTFTTSLLPELVTAGLVEVSRIVPAQYTEDLEAVANQLSYLLGTAIHPSGSVDIEPMRVEVWDPTTDPDTFVTEVSEAGTEWSYHDSGWSFWNGYLTLPTNIVRGLQGHEDDYVIRVWGYAPYAIPDDDADVLPLSQEAEQAVIKFARVEGLELLLSNRDLFTQWQTRSGNSDISPAGLMNQLSMARSDWRQYSRAIQRLRSQV